MFVMFPNCMCSFFSFFEPLHKAEQHVFGIRHFTGRVVYNSSNFLSTNHDLLPDDIVCVFSHNNCNFGFVSYLFAAEIKASMGEIMVWCTLYQQWFAQA